MSTISRKNINTLIEKFLKNPSELENYMKGQLNVLKQINNLKLYQYDDTIDDFNYFKNYFNSITLDSRITKIYEEYKKELLSIISTCNIINIKTNIFYVDTTRNFCDNIINYMNDTINIDINRYFSRMICSLYIDPNKYDKSIINVDKIYDIEEILNICNEYNLLLIDNHIVSDNISLEEMIDGINSNTLVLNKACVYSYDINNKIISDFIACTNESDRMIWQLLYGTFFHYLRISKISFDSSDDKINLSKDYNETLNHIMDVIATLKLRYKKKKKDIPSKITNIIDNILKDINNEKNSYKIYSKKLIK